MDCSAVPDSPVSPRVIPGARGHHGLVFDDVGNVIGNDGSSLLQSDYTGSGSVLVPGTGPVEGLGRLAEGDFVDGTGWP